MFCSKTTLNGKLDLPVRKVSNSNISAPLCSITESGKLDIAYVKTW
jgi:hypothetical protein